MHLETLSAFFPARSGSALAVITFALHSDQFFMFLAPTLFGCDLWNGAFVAYRQVADYPWPRNLWFVMLCEKDGATLGSSSTKRDPSISPICRGVYNRLRVRWRVLPTLETTDYLWLSGVSWTPLVRFDALSDCVVADRWERAAFFQYHATVVLYIVPWHIRVWSGRNELTNLGACY